MMNLPTKERPRERCLESGPACLSLRECLALILGSGPPNQGCLGLANKILKRPGDGFRASDEEVAFFTAMEVAGISHLQGLPGLGPAGQAKIMAAFELGRRYALFRNKSAHHKLERLSLPQLASKGLKKISTQQRNEPQEWLGFVPLLRTGELGEFCLVEKGVRTHVNIDPVELFARLLALRPKGVLLFHNHPSGHTVPSPQDLDLTERVAGLCVQFGILLLGHWIVAPQQERWIPPHL